MRLLIANGYVIDPAQGTNTGKHLLIEDGRVFGLSSHSEGVPEGADGTILQPSGLTNHCGLAEMRG
jgi:formylmethanofuran dehydrogenase subunit A